MKYAKYILIVLFLFYSVLQAQMTGWKLVTDKDSNRYYIDSKGKLHTSGEPESDYKPVSADGLDYYVKQGIELINNHYKKEGLYLLKSIVMLHAGNGKIYDAQKRAVEEINKMSQTEGTRFDQINKDSSILLILENNEYKLINDNMRYSIKTKYPITLISKRMREEKNYRYYGILLGIKFNSTAENQTGYDLLTAVDCEELSIKIRSAKETESRWRKRLGSDTNNRSVIQETNKQILYEYRDKFKPFYSGIELFIIKLNRCYFLKIIADENIFNNNKEEIIKMANDFTIN
jgi:hypothetical protein